MNPTNLLSQEVSAVQSYIIGLLKENEKLETEKVMLQHQIIRLEDTIDDHTNLRIENKFLKIQVEYLSQSIFYRYLLLYKQILIDNILLWPVRAVHKILKGSR